MYAYSSNNPINGVDPSGLVPIVSPNKQLGAVISVLRKDSYYGSLINDLEQGSEGFSLIYADIYSEAGTGNPFDKHIRTKINPAIAKSNSKVLELLVAHELFHAWLARTKRSGSCGQNRSLWEEITAERHAQDLFKRRGGTRKMLVDFEKANPQFKDYVNFYDLFNNPGVTEKQLIQAAQKHWNNNDYIRSRGGDIQAWPTDLSPSQRSGL